MADDKTDWPVFELWKEYEKITMHFNDLIIRLRTQALAGVAALSTLVGIFAKTELTSNSWLIAGLVFVALAAFWIAIWIIDFAYYNKLLIGSVTALLRLERLSLESRDVQGINMSTLVEASVAGDDLDRTLSWRQWFKIIAGRWAFYIIVLLALAAGAIFSFYTHRNRPTPKTQAVQSSQSFHPATPFNTVA
jgi:hypothetical protein